MRALILLSLMLTPTAWAQGDFADPRINDELEALKNEPSIQRVQSAALQFFKIDPDTVGSMRSRSVWKWVLPEVSAGYRINDGTVDVERVNRLTFDDTRPVELDEATAGVREVVIQGSWALPRLVFNPETLDVSSLVVLQEKILKEVTVLYYTRRRLQVDLIISPPRDAATRMSKELRIEQLTATLDAMTGNLYSRAAKRRR